MADQPKSPGAFSYQPAFDVTTRQESLLIVNVTPGVYAYDPLAYGAASAHGSVRGTLEAMRAFYTALGRAIAAATGEQAKADAGAR